MAVAGGLVLVALVLQVAVFPHLAWEGIVPNFCLLVVVAAALVRGPAFAATLGFFAGLLLDLAPPADHVAGRWALALVVVGYVAGLMRQDTRPTATTVVATVAASSFIGTSVYALSGVVLGDAVAGSGDLVRIVLVVPAVGRAPDPARAARGDAAVHPAGAGERLMKPSTPPNAGTERSRLRLVVVRVLVFSLFATLFARLYYLQVVSGDAYHAAAASQSLREVVVQPQRGLIVDDQGRPLVANRTAWVVSVDRTLLDRLSAHDRAVVLCRVATAVDTPLRQVKQALVTCGDPGSVRGRCWNGSPYQPVPVALDVRQSVALRILEQPEDYPAVVTQQQSLRAYPSPYGVNLADIVGYLSPITAGELDPRPQAPRHLGQRRQHRRPRRRRAGVRPLPARSARLPAGRGRLDGPGARQRRQGARPARRHPGHLHRRQGAGHHRACAGRRDPHGPRDVRPGDPPQLPRRLRRRDRAAGAHRPRRRDGQPADVRPVGVGRRHLQQAAGRALLQEVRRPAARPRAPGAVRPRLHLEAVHDRRRAQQRLHARAPGSTAPPASRSATGSSTTTSPSRSG